MFRGDSTRTPQPEEVGLPFSTNPTSKWHQSLHGKPNRSKTWKSHLVLRQVKLAVIYRPPPSKRNKSTVGLFLSEFQDFLQHHMVKSQNTLILGDFNFHYEGPLNTDATRIHGIFSNHSLCQYVSGPTHMDGLTLGLIITKLTENLVSKSTVSDFLTDHGAVH